jgi:hypothetical protein
MFRIVQRYTGLLAAVFVFLTTSCLHAQTPIVEEPNYTPTLTFDVATIRLAPPPDANFHVSVSSPPHSSRFEATNLPIKALLHIAYGFDAPVDGAPDWTTTRSTTYRLVRTKQPTPGSPSSPITKSDWKSGMRFACC